MNVINIAVHNKIAYSPDKDAVIVCGNDDYVINFEFDESWNEHNLKTARFIFNGSRIDVVFEGNSVDVPVIYKSTVLSVGVFAGDIQTTTPCIIPCLKSILCEDGLVAEPTPDVYQQLLSKCDEVIQVAKSATPYVGDNGNWYEYKGDKYVDSGKPSRGEQGPKGDTGPPGENGTNGKDGVSVTHKWGGTVLTITSASGTTSADLKGEKGERGLQGEQGIQGIQGLTGEKGEQGDPGIPGKDGSNGISPTITFEQTDNGYIMTTIDADGSKSIVLLNGKDGLQGIPGDVGPQGEKGDKGDDGHTPINGVDYFTDAEKEEMVQEVLANFTNVSEVGQ